MRPGRGRVARAPEQERYDGQARRPETRRSLRGTHATPPLAWQRRYPHIDGFINPWTHAGKLRKGLTLDPVGRSRHYRGAYFRGSEFTFQRSALRCFSDVQLDPYFGPTTDCNRRGVVIACGSSGRTSFGRFVISRRS
jgi:hypothetical protein